MTQWKLNYGSDGPVILDVIEIIPGESLLGADLEPLASFGNGWISIANRGENSIYFHITQDLILLSLRDFTISGEEAGQTPDESSMTLPPSLNGEEEQPA